MPVSHIETNRAPVAVSAVLVSKVGADVTVRAVTKVEGENCSALAERVECNVVKLQEVRNLSICTLDVIIGFEWVKPKHK
jgi:hypothetical protein